MAATESSDSMQSCGGRLVRSCSGVVGKRDVGESYYVRHAWVTDQIANPSMEVQPKLISSGLVVERQTVVVASEPNQAPIDVSVFTGEDFPGHLYTAVQGQLH